MVELICDICKRLLRPTDDAMPTMKDHFHSVKITWNYTGGEKSVDLCPKCEKRMIRYLRKEAKAETDMEDVPAVDAEEVVRCKDCQWFMEHTAAYRSESGKDGSCACLAGFTDCGKEQRLYMDFCSYGRRKEVET